MTCPNSGEVSEGGEVGGGRAWLVMAGLAWGRGEGGGWGGMGGSFD